MSTFSFKQFDIVQNDAAAKVGTDGVLLGAWAGIDHQPHNILDIGTGTGLIALMLAQRFPIAQISAVEIDLKAYHECQLNIQRSPWSHRIKAFNNDFLKFKPNQTFDLIVSNPPFYKEQVYSPNQKRNQARQEKHLPFENLIIKSSQILSQDGLLALIVPYKEEKYIIELAKKQNLFPSHICHVKGNLDAPFKRSLMQLSFDNCNIEYTELIIEKERHKYTQDYINLTRDFYLKM